MTTHQSITDIRSREYDVDDLFLERWSPRSFLDKEVPEEVLYTVLEAAKWAPSASNIQPWRFIVAQTEADREKFHSFIYELNRNWCEKAPVLILFVSKKTMADGNPNPFHQIDAGAAWASIALQAKMLGLVTHGMGGLDREKAREVLSVPDDFEIHHVAAIGYQGAVNALPEPYQEREKPSLRKPLSETVFEGEFGKEVKGI
ncbi:nitroreductase family protein [Lentibacillus saliphilus]|uniref:nitroreductase family protein n=1 Tax=Lentibacillus saliphilus TaxID=2737028 RepID=UPI001C310515|nr:nitroreductase family protein [Lentibacillus saliphilus]